MGLGAVVANKLHETVVENPTLEVALKLFANITRKNPSLGSRLDRSEEGLHVLCHELVKNRLLWPATVVFDRKSAHEAQLAGEAGSRETTSILRREMSLETGQFG